MSFGRDGFVCVSIVFNIVSSLVIVVLNKWIYVNVGFPNITLTFIHFVCTFVGLWICLNLDVFYVKSLPIIQMLPLAASFCGFVVFTNLSLQHNTVGTYQVAKVMTTPCILFIQMSMYKKTFSRRVKMTLIPITVGCIMNFYYDIKFNTLGAIFATLGVLVTSVYQVWVGEKQKEFQVNSMQLLYYQAPLSAVLLIFIIPAFEPVSVTLQHDWTTRDIAIVLASGCIAFFINLSIYWIIRNTSPLTYNMMGHLKFCSTVMSGYLLFDETLQPNQIWGLILTVAGVAAYSYFKMQEQKTPVLPTKSGHD